MPAVPDYPRLVRPGLVVTLSTCAFSMERVSGNRTRTVGSGIYAVQASGLTCEADYPSVTTKDPSSPG